jgi:hypothetical protein
MDLYTDHIQPAELTGYARTALEDLAVNRFILSRWLPEQTVPDLMYRVERGRAGLLDVADYRAFDAEPTTGRREGISRMEGSLPPLAQQYLLGEFDQMMTRGAGADEIRNALLRDGERIAEAIGRRMEVARADAIFNGSVTIAENHAQITVDFERREDHDIVLTGSILDPATEVLEQLLAARQRYIDTNGDEPGAILANERVMRALQANDEIRNYILGPNSATAQRVRRQDVFDFLADEGLPPWVPYEARATRVVRNAAGEATGRVTGRITPENKIAFLPQAGEAISETAGPLGATLWGPPLESRFSEYGLAGNEPGLVVASFIERRTPAHVNTIGSAIGLPVMGNPDASLVIEVFPEGTP